MSHAVITEVQAVVPADREQSLVAGFEDLLRGPLPDGMLGTDLVRGSDGSWRILSRWGDRAALEAMRAGSEPPAAPALFRRFGAEPMMTVLDVVAGWPSP
jgi:hypothetical protein